jgi:glycine/D-amino acid oxidase-like deaminating enzyme
MWLASTREQYEHALRSYLPAPADVTRTPASGGVLDAAALCALEPALSRALHGAVLFPGCATANPREVMLAALADAREVGVRVLEGGGRAGCRPRRDRVHNQHWCVRCVCVRVERSRMWQPLRCSEWVSFKRPGRAIRYAQTCPHRMTRS